VLSEERDIIEWSFETARKYFPDEVLVINEANPIQKLAREDYRTPYFMMVENALLNGAEIDKIGLQNHFFAGAGCQTPEDYERDLKSDGGLKMNDPTAYFKGLDVMAELGLPLELTEVTVPTFGDGEEAEELQADMLKLWYSVWFSHPAVDSVVYWNTVDGYAYVVKDGSRVWNENNCRGGLWHKDLTPKKSAEMLKALFNEKWHTDLELTTDKNGYIDFRGFFGEYEGEIDGMEFDFEIHKNDNNRWEILA
jgi:GH35 family endo-1,4-beta-xylanase